MRLHAIEAGMGSPVVLLHGLFGSARNFGAVQRALAGEGVGRVIALDLRNHGASPHDPDMRYAAMAGDVAETLAALDALPAAVIGHSMGGKVAMRLALAMPEAVASLVVADIAPVAYPPHFAAIAAAMAALPMQAGPMQAGPVQAGPVEAGMSRAGADATLEAAVPDPALRAFLLQNFIPGTPGAWRIGLDEIIAALDGIGGWEAPAGAVYSGRVMVLAGERSDYIRREDRAAFRVLFPAARFVTLRHAGHWLHADNPAGFHAAIVAFLRAGAD